MGQPATSTWIGELRRLLGDDRKVSTSAAVLENHSHDLSYHTPRLPEAVVFPESTEEVSAVLRFANERRIPVVPFGVGSSLEGHVVPVRGGISLDLTRMDEIVEVRPDDFLVRVQAGVTRSRLNLRLAREGLFFPVDPGADATIGGMVATNASGTNAVRYGAMKHQVLGLEVVLADGSVIRTGSRAVKSSAGYNLTGLFIGSEGTLGVVTEATLRVYPLPEHVVAARASFPTVEAAARVAVGLIRAGVPVARVELVDEATIRAVNAYKGTGYPERPTLFLEFSGTEAGVRADVEFARELAALEECLAFEFESDPQAREKLWEARHHAALAIAATAPGKKMMVTDVCVPLSQLPDAIRHARQMAEEHGVHAAILGHVGDGNYHAAFMVDPQDPEDVARAERVNAAIVEYALARGGTCTGEHGVGLGKKKYLATEHGPALALMRAIKRALDPNGILNPGKVIDPVVDGTGAAG
ncbi:MAG TPA: FAD-linked oxidase C-terminal domain-containing protein [Thermaerobacter sp.]